MPLANGLTGFPKAAKSFVITVALGVVGEMPLANGLAGFPKAANKTTTKHAANSTCQGELDRSMEAPRSMLSL